MSENNDLQYELAEFKAEVESHPYFTSRGFLFNEFPPISRLKTLLKNFESSLF